MLDHLLRPDGGRVLRAGEVGNVLLAGSVLPAGRQVEASAGSPPPVDADAGPPPRRRATPRPRAAFPAKPGWTENEVRHAFQP